MEFVKYTNIILKMFKVGEHPISTTDMTLDEVESMLFTWEYGIGRQNGIRS